MLTGERGQVWPARHVVSEGFCDWDRMPFLGPDPCFGPAAAWTLRHRPFMLRPHVIADGACVEIAGDEIAAALRSMPSVAVIVPVSRQKHLAPFAAWGEVTCDTDAYRWTRDDDDTLGTYRALRTLGFGETALTEPVPRWPILSRLPREERMWVLRRWGDLDRWRHRPGIFDVAARATRAAKEAA